ncbi:MAG: hypothetical protein DBW93_03365 [SAR86 cluster bacterium]|nr:MAG: hypothetical protein DBW93_03365 [SAR86 cluster bacterium]|tara:strand:- start:645 stop:1298 length:654 start_codon:yes stop_codon:yes gene_type:complete
MKFTIRKIHKYLSLFISLQLLLWTASGIYFAYNKIENVRGEQYREQTSFSVDLSKINFEVEDISTLSFANRLNERVVVIRDTQGKKYFDFDGNLIDKISFEDALKVVKTKTNLSPLLVEEVTEAKKRAEYRGRDLPIYRVVSKNKKNEEINVYVNPYSGDISAVRSTQWRIWDLLWGFHIMDWQDRDNIGNIFLKIFSVLALLSAITGIVLFFKKTA